MSYYLQILSIIGVDMKKAFTLAEVLITLGIIGVVAALTLPTLISNYQEKVLVNQLKVAYSTFAQAYEQALEEHGPSEHWDIGSRDSAVGANKLYQIMKPYFLNAEDCGLTKNKCFYTGTYKALFNDKWAWQPATHLVYAKGRLKNGVSFFFWSNGSGCPDNICGSIVVDVNGEKSPNQAGVDYFSFDITPTSINPKDGIPPARPQYGHICKYNNTSNVNGASCTAWVLVKENMDYRRRDITSEWRGSN